MTLRRWKITIQYDGTDFKGWQKQPDLPTIQGSIETAIEKFYGQAVEVTTAGRTDAGVHAHGQVAHFDIDNTIRDMDGFHLAKAINAHLMPLPIAVIHVEPVADDFNARFDATKKTYRYRLICRRAPAVMDTRFAWHFKYDLDVEAMRKGAEHLIGHHDFSSFRDAQCQAKTPMRTLDRLDIFETAYDPFGAKEIVFELTAQSFIHHQCRNIVGTLVDVGKGKIKPAAIKTILEAKDRTQAGMTAPACGLSLIGISYNGQD